jgi:hypothetical protein
MKKVEITCDGCGRDLTTTSNSVDYRLVLASESKPGYGSGFYTDMMVYPPVDRAHHFCDLACLDHWRSREYHKSGLWREWNENWKTEHGTKHQRLSGEGFTWSYPVPPDDVVKEREAAFEAKALEAFPMQRPKH